MAITIEELKEHLEKKDRWVIPPGAEITEEAIELFKKYLRKTVYDLFQQDPDKTGFRVTYRCPRCHNVVTEQLSKNRLMLTYQIIDDRSIIVTNDQILSRYPDIGPSRLKEIMGSFGAKHHVRYDDYKMCPNCEIDYACEVIVKKSFEIDIKTFRQEERIKQELDKFIADYLVPDEGWPQYGENAYGALCTLRKRLSPIKGVVSYYIKTMPKGAYYQTRAWKIIAANVKERDSNKCAVCDSDLFVFTHHKTYAHYGLEAYHLDDLVCLCAEHHGKVHGR